MPKVIIMAVIALNHSKAVVTLLILEFSLLFLFIIGCIALIGVCR